MKAGHDLKLEMECGRQSNCHRNITGLSHPVSLACLTRSPQVFSNSLIHPAAICATETPITLIGCLVKHFHPKILETYIHLGALGSNLKFFKPMRLYNHLKGLRR